MRKTNDDPRDTTMHSRVLALLRAERGRLSFAVLAAKLGCDEPTRPFAGDPQPERAQALVVADARRERKRLQRVLQRLEAEGLLQRVGDDVVLREASG